MMISMLASILLTKSMVLVFINLLMDTAMKDHGMKARSRDLEYIHFVMEIQDVESGIVGF